MSTSRTALISKTQKVLKKHYKPYAPPKDRPLLEHILYACCLQNASPDAADEAFAKLQELYFDWNEVRVTTVKELAEVMSMVPDAADAAARLKGCLQSVFEAHYTFDIDFMKKQNISKTVKELERFGKVSNFVIAYATQYGLAGHSIPVNEGAFQAFLVLGVINEAELAKKRVPGLERTISKAKGAEFGSLLQQLGTEYRVSPFSPRLRSILLEIAPDAKDRFPKRKTKKATKAAPASKEKPKTTKKVPPKKKKTTTSIKKKTATPAAKSKKKTAAAKSKSQPAKKSATKKLSKKKPR